jgi:hypothetical protein
MVAPKSVGHFLWGFLLTGWSLQDFLTAVKENLSFLKKKCYKQIMDTMYIVDGKKLATARQAAGLSRNALGRQVVKLSGGTIACSHQKVGAWEQSLYSPSPDVTPFLQVALGVSFDQIAKPVEWPENLPKVKKSVDRGKKIL